MPLNESNLGPPHASLRPASQRLISYHARSLTALWIGTTMPMSRALDTVAMARQKFPGAPVSLDALCRRWGIDNSNRTLHGALLDSELLAEVYLELIGGRQPDLVLVAEPARAAEGPAATTQHRPRAARPAPLAPRITAAEREAHAAFVARMGGKALWLRDVPAN